MEMKKSAFSYLEPLYMESRVFEQTQELRIPEGMPDAEKILGVWGQSVLRSKDWRTDTVGFSAGISLWVMYRPEDGTAPRMLEGWVPIQGKWILPQETPEVRLLLNLAPAFLDGRVVSPRKLLVRCGLGATVQALAPAEGVQYTPVDLPEDVYTLERTEKLMLYTEAGEKTFQIEETPGKLLCCAVRGSLTDQKVVGNKLAFRGNLEIQALLDGETPEEREFQFPFSQIAELDKAFGSEAQSEITLCVTSLELEEETLKLGLTAQYAIWDRVEIRTLTDAYSNRRPVELTREESFFPSILESFWEAIPCRGTLPESIPGAASMTAWTDPAGIRRREEGTALTAQGTAQILWEGEKGLLGAQIPLEGEKLLRPAGEVTVTASQPGKPTPDLSGGGVNLEVKCHVVTLSREPISQVTGLDLGELTAPDPDRPSLILCRAEKKDLWTLAKETGSTVEAIQKANGLEGEPPQGKMLLIPIA